MFLSKNMLRELGRRARDLVAFNRDWADMRLALVVAQELPILQAALEVAGPDGAGAGAEVPDDLVCLRTMFLFAPATCPPAPLLAELPVELAAAAADAAACRSNWPYFPNDEKRPERVIAALASYLAVARAEVLRLTAEAMAREAA